MLMVRNPETPRAIREAHESAGADKVLRSYYLPLYLVEIIDLLAAENGMSRTQVLRLMAEEWVQGRLPAG